MTQCRPAGSTTRCLLPRSHLGTLGLLPVLLMQMSQRGERGQMSFTSVPGGAPLTLNTKPIWGNPKANPRDEHTVAPAHGSSPFSRALSPIPRGGFAARSSLPCTLPLVAANSVTQERHGVMPACPQPALGLARELFVPVPAGCRVGGSTPCSPSRAGGAPQFPCSWKSPRQRSAALR